jgi:hypothetical protein
MTDGQTEAVIAGITKPGMCPFKHLKHNDGSMIIEFLICDTRICHVAH